MPRVWAACPPNTASSAIAGCKGLRRALLAGTALMALSLPATAADFFAANESELATAIASANASGDAVNTITITTSINLTAPLPILDAQAGTQLVIAGGGNTIDGQNSQRIFFANSGNIAIRNVTLANGAAVGGAGGSSVDGGGGAFPGQDGQSATTDAGADGGGPIGGVGGS